MATATSTASPPKDPLAKRTAKVAAGIVLLLIAPMLIAWVFAGPMGAGAALMSVVAGVSGAIRSGWQRMARVVPLVGAYSLVMCLVGYGWGWVALMGLVGLLAGIGLPYGYLPALLYAGMVPTMLQQARDTREAVLVAVMALLGGALGVAAARRLGAAAAVPGKAGWAGHEALSGALCAAVFVAGTAIAVATGLPHGYWVALSLIVVIPPIVQGDDSKRGRERLIGTIAGLLIVIPVSLIPLPRWAFYVIGFALLVPAFAVMRRNYTYYAFMESAAVVMLVSAGTDMVGTDAARVEASAIAVALVAAAVVGIAWGVRHVSSSDVAKDAISP